VGTCGDAFGELVRKRFGEYGEAIREFKPK
jgi:hypothetical protein